MQPISKSRRKTANAVDLKKLKEFGENVASGKIVPFKEETERAWKELKKAGLIK